jgi:MFS transporter, DHA2 family, multidrug resistance protein
MTPPTGWVAARFGRKQLFIVTVAGFTIASILCGMAASLEQMVVFRLLQGVFGAPLVPLSQSVLLDTYPREKHGSAMALWGVGVMVGPILGPTLGGYLTDVYNWRWVFYINVPIGILTIVGLLLFLPATHPRRGHGFDWFGFAALSIAIGALQMMLDRGEQLDWFSSTEIVVETTIAGLAAYLFLVHMATAERPFIEPRIFRDRNFVTGLCFIFLVGIILLATLALLTPFLQNLMNYPVLTAGIVLAPRGLGTMIAMFLVGRIINKVDVRLLILIGLSLVALSLYEMEGFTTDVSQGTLIRTGFTQGLGLGFVFVPLSTTTFSTLAPEHRTQGTALFALMRNLGSSIGISLVIFLLTRNTQVVHAELAEHVTPFNELLRAQGVAGFWNMALPSGVAALNEEVTRQATMIAYIDDFRAMTMVAFAAMPLVLFLRRPQRPASAEAMAIE